jgi:two-component system LytT family sensor kinase
MVKLKSWRFFNLVAPLLLWVIVFSLPYFSGADNFPKEFREQHLRSMLAANLFLIITFYVHGYFIYPLREKKNGLIIYFALLMVCMAIYLATKDLFRPDFTKNPMFMPKGPNQFGPPPFNIMMIFPFLFTIAVSFCHQLYLEKVSGEKLTKERENIHLKTELAFLSSQISPHFMFNTLNTMVAMARKKSEDLESSLINLSQLMRYMLYDTHGKPINLADEVEYLKSYINLQLIRFKDDVKVNIQLTGNFENYLVEPMLLVPFIENAFKHGIGNIQNPNIDISIQIDEKESILKFMVINNVSKIETIVEKSSGIGLNNVKRRLELLYPARHLFYTQQKDNTFIAMLQITL